MPEPSSKSPIEVSQLSKSFGPQKVLAGIDLAVHRAETLVVLGRSGTGKSVLLKLLIGLQKPDRGSIRIHGKEITRMNTEELNETRKRMGFLFQQAALYDSLTVEGNVAFPMARHTKLSEQERHKRVGELLASVGMEKAARKMPSEISGGMQRRVGLARALALDPDILLFDEPTSGLDPITAGEIGELISNLKKEKQLTSIVVTHDVRGAEAFADRFIMLHEGRIAGEGTLKELKQSHEEFVSRYLAAVA